MLIGHSEQERQSSAGISDSKALESVSSPKAAAKKFRVEAWKKCPNSQRERVIEIQTTFPCELLVFQDKVRYRKNRFSHSLRKLPQLDDV